MPQGATQPYASTVLSSADLINNVQDNIKPASGPLVTNFNFKLINNGAIAVAAGTLVLAAIDLPKGFVVQNIFWCSGTTAASNSGTPHYWTALYDQAKVLKGQSTDNTAKAIAASTLITDALATAYTTTYSGLHYIGIMDLANTTQPTASGYSGLVGPLGLLSSAGFALNGTADTGLTTAAPATAGAITATANIPWVGVS